MQTPEDFTNAVVPSTGHGAVEGDHLTVPLSELPQLEIESMGWIPLDDGVYLHLGSEDGVVEIVGLADAGMAGANVLWIV